jgi:hypothetical protein
MQSELSVPGERASNERFLDLIGYIKDKRTYVLFPPVLKSEGAAPNALKQKILFRNPVLFEVCDYSNLLMLYSYCTRLSLLWFLEETRCTPTQPAILHL